MSLALATSARRSILPLLFVAALATSAKDSTAETAFGRQDRSAAWTARLVAPTPYSAVPGGGRSGILQPFTPVTGSSTTLLVLGRAVRNGEVWLRVRLPFRPNDASGWIRRDDAVVTWTPYRIEISTRRRLLTLLRAGRVVLRTRVVVGASGTPTPQGVFALYETIPLPRSPYAPYELQLTAHSDVLRAFDGGEGRVALHGMNGALRVPLGTSRSHGCIRLLPRTALLLAHELPLGSPVVISP
jgi:lipoprotein-anchoring transpeptidase ErfK/SrfK